jgi:hypothetical protein
MRRLLLGYLLWVVVPVSFATGIGRAWADKAAEGRILESGVRFGALARELLMTEMGARTGELAGEAPVLTDPDETTPIIRTALQGDTVAALGTLSGDLVLSVALAEEAENGLGRRIRAITEPFLPDFPSRFRGAMGYSAALYFRGERVLAEPDGFGPGSLGSRDLEVSSEEAFLLNTSTGPAVLSSLVGGPTSAPTLHALVGPAVSSPASLPGVPSRLTLLLGATFGGLFLMAGILGATERGRAGRGFRVAAYTLPVVIMWIGLLDTGQWLRTNDADFTRSELVRVQAVLSGLEPRLEPTRLAQATRFEVTRISKEAVESTLEAGPALEALKEISVPASGPPSVGMVSSGTARLAYAGARPDSGTVLVVSTPIGGESKTPRWILLVVLGAATSMLGLVFLLRNEAGRGGD